MLEFVQLWMKPVIEKGGVLRGEEWFIEGHGIIGGRKDVHEYGSPYTSRTGELTFGALHQSLLMQHWRSA